MDNVIAILILASILLVLWIGPLLIAMAILRLENWFSGLEPWDGAHRIDPVMQWLIGVFGIPILIFWIIPGSILKKIFPNLSGQDLIRRFWHSILLMHK